MSPIWLPLTCAHSGLIISRMLARVGTLGRHVATTSIRIHRGQPLRLQLAHSCDLTRWERVSHGYPEFFLLLGLSTRACKIEPCQRSVAIESWCIGFSAHLDSPEACEPDRDTSPPVLCPFNCWMEKASCYHCSCKCHSNGDHTPSGLISVNGLLQSDEPSKWPSATILALGEESLPSRILQLCQE